MLSACPVLPPVTVALADALGCVTAESVVATEPIPAFANTAMDGFAVRAADTASAPATLRIAGTLAAGAAPTTTVEPGTAVRIMTGAPIPAGADAVVMIELTATDGDTVRIEQSAAVGDHIRAAGDDIRPGDEVVAVGTALGPGHLGVLASVGRTTVRVHPRARVAVASTGDELVEGPGTLRPGQLRDSNRPLLLACLAETGCEAVDVGIIRDDPDAIEAAFRKAVADADAVVTSGGVSMGDFDYVKVVLERLSDDMAWMQVAIRPAKPLAFGTIRSDDGRAVPLFGLPGNPVSSLVSFELFTRPGLRTMMGHPAVDRPRIRAVADEALSRRPDGKTHLLRVRTGWGPDGRLHVRPVAGQGSHQLAAAASAEALAVVADGDGVEAGSDVDVLLLRSPS